MHFFPEEKINALQKNHVCPFQPVTDTHNINLSEIDVSCFITAIHFLLVSSFWNFPIFEKFTNQKDSAN